MLSKIQHEISITNNHLKNLSKNYEYDYLSMHHVLKVKINII